ncbi:MAG: ABC transporter permease [Chloroflexi bacterium]|nr:ABC transporter permease [Chloroflexota bacterium]
MAIRTAPGGPAYVLLGAERATPEAVARVNQQLGLDKPLPEQLVVWTSTLLHGDMGFSYFFRRPAIEVVQERLPATLLLGGCAWLLSSSAGVAAGVWAARRRGAWIDRLLSTAAIGIVATPTFWMGIVLIVIFAAWLHLLPSAGLAPVGQENDLGQRVRYLLLPLLALAAPHGASLALYTRATMLEALAADYVRTARAKGLGDWRVAWRHALRNAGIPILTIVGLNIPHLVEGSVVVESVFAWPGIGQLTVASVGRRDYPVLLAITLLVALAVVLANLATDLVYRAVDPRIEFS